MKNFLSNLIPAYTFENTKLVSTFEVLGIQALSVGDDTFIGHQILIYGSSDTKVILGRNVDIFFRVTIITGTHKIIPEGDRVAGLGYGEDIIKNGSWIGVGSAILPGATIGKNSIVAAGAVVSKNVDDFTMVAGVPAVVKRRLKGYQNV